MKPSPYLIEFHGGRFDGYRQPSDFVLPSTRLEMPGPEPLDGRASARRNVYEHRRSTVTFVNESPVVTFHLHFAGIIVAAPQTTPARHWVELMHAILRRLQPGLRPLPHNPNNGFRIPSGRKAVVLNGQN
jgi:hypothetical protein